jgi:CheY-like chemotaxis protein
MSSNHESSISSPPRSVIVVDDEIELATLFKSFLQNEGYDAVSFSDPIIALEYFKETSARRSLIITDMRMPGMCGIELAKKIRQINDKIKIFLMTAFDISDLENHPDFKAACIDRLLQKPIRFSELRGMINTAWKKN